ncbi:AAA family ATPase [Microvirga sp. CF3016]|uniref:AAA family ATPase n=1 Tax=Microvirga sp. CF3016 TaxID=3110181 RepID=UPI002E75F78E|nr:AAA family ATPase [Microvirga sp. CF3016]MEE1611891.1 AAA family ATPase [Microvirga sp. CF3016]
MTAVSAAGEPVKASTEAIALGARLDDLRVIVPAPERPDTTHRRQNPAYIWPMIEPTGQRIGFLCVYGSGEAEEIGVWIYGENRARAQRWSFRRVPEFRDAIAANSLKSRPDAVIVALAPQQTAGETLPSLTCDRDFVPVVVTFDQPIPRPRKPPVRSLENRRSASLEEKPAGDPAPGPLPVAEEEAGTSGQTQRDAERPGIPAPSEGEARRGSMLADRAEMPMPPPLETARSSGSRSGASELLQQPQAVQISTIRAADVNQQRVSWLWPDRIPLGKLTIIVGDPGLGKSLLGAYLAATVSQGALWPITEDPAPKGSVLLVSTEDDIADTIVPRLHAAGAETQAVHLCQGTEHGSGRCSLDLTRDIEALEQVAADLSDLKLIVIDPITACLGRANQNTAGAVRAVMTRLAEFAARTGVAVVVISHLNKSASRSAMMRATGSLAFVAVARAAFLVTKDPVDSDRRLLLPIKSNLSADRQGLSFRVESAGVGSGTAPHLVFDDEPVAISADVALNETRSIREARSALDEAKDFLLECLADGAMPALEVKAAAQGMGISSASLRRAKEELGITPKKSGMAGEWRWMLPEHPKALTTAEDAHSDTMSTFVTDEHLRLGHDARASQGRADQHE